MKTRRTPGPWRAVRFRVLAGPREVADASEITSDLHGGTPDEGLANALLIAAAPELLESLRDQRAWLRHWLEFTVHVQVKDERGYVVNSFAAVQIPDWAVKQKLDSLDIGIAKAEGQEHQPIVSASSHRSDEFHDPEPEQ